MGSNSLCCCKYIETQIKFVLHKKHVVAGVVALVVAATAVTQEVMVFSTD